MAAEPGTLSDLLNDEVDEGESILAEAWGALEVGNADRAQGRLILADLALKTGFYEAAPDITRWVGSAEAYQIYCMQHEARRRVFAGIVRFLSEHPKPPVRRVFGRTV